MTLSLSFLRSSTRGVELTRCFTPLTVWTSLQIRA